MQRLHVDLLIFSVFFSLFFCVACSLVDSFISFWMFIELRGLSLIPAFFWGCNLQFYNYYSSLLSYIVISGISSVLIVTGLLINELYFFLLIGFFLKFGLFPFSLWFYRVFKGRNWLFIFIISVISKYPVLFFCYLLQSGYTLIIFLDCGFTVLMCAVLFWRARRSWELIWCHISLSSISTLLVACFCSDFFNCSFIYVYYSFWALFSILYFRYLGRYLQFKSRLWIYIFLLLITPISVPLFYKLAVRIAILYSSWYLLVAWAIYSFSEQFFLFKLCADSIFRGVYKDWDC